MALDPFRRMDAPPVLVFDPSRMIVIRRGNELTGKDAKSIDGYQRCLNDMTQTAFTYLVADMNLEVVEYDLEKEFPLWFAKFLLFELVSRPSYDYT